MGLTASDYVDLLQGLLPDGLAWRKGNTDTTQRRVLQAWADELARVHARALQLTVEAIPRTTSELITDWERVLGLPDTCAGQLDNLEARRNAVVAKLGKLGGQTPQFYIDLAAQLGYAITITEFRPFRVGQSAVGDPITGEDWLFYWQVNGLETNIRYFQTGRSTVGEPLRSWGNTPLECYMRQYKPAHTTVIFAYT